MSFNFICKLCLVGPIIHQSAPSTPVLQSPHTPQSTSDIFRIPQSPLLASGRFPEPVGLPSTVPASYNGVHEEGAAGHVERCSPHVSPYGDHKRPSVQVASPVAGTSPKKSNVLSFTQQSIDITNKGGSQDIMKSPDLGSPHIAGQVYG